MIVQNRHTIIIGSWAIFISRHWRVYTRAGNCGCGDSCPGVVPNPFLFSIQFSGQFSTYARLILCLFSAYPQLILSLLPFIPYCSFSGRLLSLVVAELASVRAYRDPRGHRPFDIPLPAGSFTHSYNRSTCNPHTTRPVHTGTWSVVY